MHSAIRRAIGRFPWSSSRTTGLLGSIIRARARGLHDGERIWDFISYVRYGAAHADLPEAFLELDILLNQHRDDALGAIAPVAGTGPTRGRQLGLIRRCSNAVWALATSPGSCRVMPAYR